MSFLPSVLDPEYDPHAVSDSSHFSSDVSRLDIITPIEFYVIEYTFYF